MNDTALSPLRRALCLAALVIAGEAIFGLPFIIARVFRPTLLDVFGITNLELGGAMAVYGVAAIIAYFPGGPIADRFPARRLMTASLVSTALGGLWFAQIPSLRGLQVLYALWGLTTILLFWAALVRATREWGRAGSQGTAYGLVDSGRGLFAAVLVSVCVALLGALLPDDPATATLAERTAALRTVIYIFGGITLFAGALIWFILPDGSLRPNDADAAARAVHFADVGRVVRNPAVWLQGVIVVAAYVGYKGIDDLGLYARDAFGFDDVKAATVGTVAFWVRPVAALGAGVVGDRVGAAPTIMLCFLLMAAGYGVFALDVLDPTAPWMLFAAVVPTVAFVYSLRGLYFAIFGDAGIPTALTGTAAGLVSVVGYTPDIFMGPMMGWMTDTWPGVLGHRVLFGTVAGTALLGLVCTVAFRLLTRKRAAA
ncbi:MAG: MFS transporter [Myxococcales bacterium]|nr:MFS transporter [Myxococcales bacterium]